MIRENVRVLDAATLLELQDQRRKRTAQEDIKADRRAWWRAAFVGNAENIAAGCVTFIIVMAILGLIYGNSQGWW